MYLDEQNLFSSKQAITGSAVSNNKIDLGGERDIGNGEPVRVLVQVTQGFAGLTRLKVALRTDEAESMGSAATLCETGNVAVADLVAGYRFHLDFIPHGSKRWLDLFYTVEGSSATAGKITAGIVTDVQSNG